MKPDKKHIFSIAIVTMLLVLCLGGVASAAKPARILVLPFAINADKDLSFLQRGIKNMLFSRLSMEGKGTLIDPLKSGEAFSLPQNNADAVALGHKFSADYVVMGNLTVFGDSVSTDCNFLDVKKGTAAVTFGDFGESHGDALAHINQFATRIREKVFGYAPRRTASPMPAAGYMMGGGMGMPFNNFNAAIWKSGKIEERIKALAVGDVDGDGANETVLMGDNRVLVYRMDQGRFVKIADEKGGPSDRYLGIDVGDINDNGKAEIFVTSYRERNRRLSSFVMEWNGSAFTRIADKEKWFFRVIGSKDGKRTLLAQGQRAEEDSDVFKRGIHEMKWEGGAYVTDRRLVLPAKTVVYGLAKGDVMNNGQENYLLLLPDGKIQVLDAAGIDLWTSSDRYGGSINYIEYPSEREVSINLTGERVMDNLYLQSRIHVWDIDGDGKNEVVVVNNQNIVSRNFSKLRSFDNGYIEALMWNTIGLQEKWKLQKVTGNITDYTVDDINNDGQKELIFSVLEKGGHLTMGKKSFVASWQRPLQ